jgi:hypothetical protein
MKSKANTNDNTVPYQKIGEIKIFVNARHIYGCDFSVGERNILGEELMKLYESNFTKAEKDEILVECYVPEKGDLVFSLNVLVKYKNLHSNISKYSQILDFISKIIDLFSGSELSLNENCSFRIAVKEYNLASYAIAIKLFEKAESEMLKESSEGKYVLFETEKDLENLFTEKIKDNFHFINCHRLTGIHEVDIKMLESRYCIAMGITQAALSILFITVEETLKTLLKYKLTSMLIRESDEEPNLNEISRVSQEAQKAYGTKTLRPCIYLARKEDLINEAEQDKFIEVANLRNGYIHSDKSKIFSEDKFPVQLVKIEENQLILVETKEMSMNELIFAQGISQKSISDREAKRLFIEIEDIVFNVCERFMTAYKTT